LRASRLAQSFLCLLAFAAVTGCASYQAVPLRDGGFPLGAVQAGDDVRAAMRSGETLAFEVVSVEGGSSMTSASGIRVEAADLTSLQIARRDKHKAQMAFSVIGGVLAAALLIHNAEVVVVCAQYDTNYCGNLLAPSPP
jgi:hypothetical protein